MRILGVNPIYCAEDQEKTIMNDAASVQKILLELKSHIYAQSMQNSFSVVENGEYFLQKLMPLQDSVFKALSHQRDVSENKESQPRLVPTMALGNTYQTKDSYIHAAHVDEERRWDRVTMTDSLGVIEKAAYTDYTELANMLKYYTDIQSANHQERKELEAQISEVSKGLLDFGRLNENLEKLKSLNLRYQDVLGVLEIGKASIETTLKRQQDLVGLLKSCMMKLQKIVSSIESSLSEGSINYTPDGGADEGNGTDGDGRHRCC